MSEEKAAEIKDELPSDLDVTKYVGPYQFPNPKKRKTASFCIFTIALFIAVLGINSSNNYLLISTAILFFIGLYFFVSGWNLNIKDLDALTLAAKKAPYSVGHASAQLSFAGWFSKPIWRVVVFSSDEPPTQKGLVEIDAINGEVTSTYFEDENANA